MTEKLGDYELEAELGHGATGTVYLARHADQRDLVALKVLAPALATDPAFRARFTREAEIMEHLADPHCVRVIAYGDDETPWIAMEYLHGATLRAVLDRAGKLTPAQACGVMLGALAGLSHAHERGVVHRDVKPENVLVDIHGESKLADFGLVAERATKTDWRAIEGSPAYMSPEQVRGEPLDPRSDLYACGAVLYELLTGEPVVSGASPVAVMHAQVTTMPDTDALPERIRAVVGSALAKDPDERPANAGEFATALQDAADRDLGPLWMAAASIVGIVAGIVSGELATRSASPRRRLARRVGRVMHSPALVAGAAAVSALVVGAVAIGVATSRSGPHRAASAATTTRHAAVGLPVSAIGSACQSQTTNWIDLWRTDKGGVDIYNVQAGELRRAFRQMMTREQPYLRDLGSLATRTGNTQVATLAHDVRSAIEAQAQFTTDTLDGLNLSSPADLLNPGPAVAASFDRMLSVQVSTARAFLAAGIPQCAFPILTQGKGPGADEASQATVASRVTSPCPSVKLGILSYKDSPPSSETLVVRPGQGAVYPSGLRYDGSAGPLHVTPGPTDGILLSNSYDRITRVTCDVGP